MNLLVRPAVAAVLTLLALPALADWPAYRGLNNDGISTHKILTQWPAEGPKVLWKANIGGGIGAFSIVGDKAYVMALPTTGGNNEFCYALEAKTGKQLWQTQLGATKSRPSPGQGGPGPCSTPFYDNGKLYCYGSMIDLFCLNAEDGKVIWKHSIQSEFNGQNSATGISQWGSASSPIIEGDLCLVAGGGPNQTIIAFNKNDGTVVWKKHSEVYTHSTPTPATIHGVRQVIFRFQSGLLAIDPRTGDELWRQAFPGAVAIAPSVVVSGDIVYATTGYNVGGGAYRISKDGNKFYSTEIWRTPNDNVQQWSTPVVKDGYLYGIFNTGNNAPLRCVELATGRRAWQGPAVGQGEVLLIDGKLLIQCADGRLRLADPNPQAYKELATAQPITGQAWGFPAYSNGLLLYRTINQMAAVDLTPQ